MDYSWDEEKAASNIEKHGVTFQEAASVFDDPLFVDFHDPDHSMLCLKSGLSHKKAHKAQMLWPVFLCFLCFFVALLK